MVGLEIKLRNHSLEVVLTVIVWTVIVAASLLWNIFHEVEQSTKLAKNEATAYFNKDMAIRYWSASHGGVYVPVTEHTPPNPNLSHIPERDITTPSGKNLTLMNPAYMLSQLMNDYSDMYGAKEKITSFPGKLLNPNNAPDQWELEALNAFNKGARDYATVTEIAGEPHFRLMKPIFIKEECLKCHAFQGYKEGDLRGGLSVSVPMDVYLGKERESIYILSISHGLFWLIGVLCLVYYFRQARAHQLALQNLNEQLESFSFRDGLTGVSNRRMLDLLMHQEWFRAMRERQPLALIMIDIDYFKQYNDCYGHLQGDECLKMIAKELSGVAKRLTDVCARYGGDEYVILLPNTGLKEAVLMAEKCRENIFSIYMPHKLSKAADVVTISAGVSAAVPAEGKSYLSLIEAADQALYQAKHGGRNRVESNQQDTHDSRSSTT